MLCKVESICVLFFFYECKHGAVTIAIKVTVQYYSKVIIQKPTSGYVGQGFKKGLGKQHFDAKTYLLQPKCEQCVWILIHKEHYWEATGKKTK